MIADFSAAIEDVLRRYEPTRPGRWRTQSINTHVAHCRAHCEPWTDRRQLADLAHGATRALMALTLALEAAAAPSEPAA